MKFLYGKPGFLRTEVLTASLVFCGLKSSLRAWFPLNCIEFYTFGISLRFAFLLL